MGKAPDHRSDAPANALNGPLEPVVTNSNTDNASEIRLAPPDCKSREHHLVNLEGLAQPIASQHESSEAIDSCSPNIQFSLAELLLLTTFFCVGSAAARWFPPAIFAFLAGASVLIAFVYLQFWPEATPKHWLVWRIALVMYLGAAFVAWVLSLKF